VYNKESFKNKINLIKQNRKHVFVLIAGCILVGIPQIIYWKIVTGHWIFNSYWNQDSFDISESYLRKILFSFRKGWFIYTPMTVFAFIGIYFSIKNKIIKSNLAIISFI